MLAVCHKTLGRNCRAAGGDMGLPPLVLPLLPEVPGPAGRGRSLGRSGSRGRAVRAVWPWAGSTAERAGVGGAQRGEHAGGGSSWNGHWGGSGGPGGDQWGHLCCGSQSALS